MVAAKQLAYAEDRRSGIEWPSAQVPGIGGTIMIEPQEYDGNCVFSASAAKVVYTPGFGALFGSRPLVISNVILKSLDMVHRAFRNPGSLQTFFYEESEFSGSQPYWAKHSGDLITFFLPDEQNDF